MWCTICNTGFNWRTGKVADGPVHNPHYFEYLRRTGQGEGAPQNIIVNCDMQEDRNVMRALYPRGRYGRVTRASGEPVSDYDYLAEAWRIMREYMDERQRSINQDEDYRRLRVRYMADELNAEDWKISLQRTEKDENYQRTVRQVRELYAGAARDLIRGIVQPEPNVAEIRRQVEELVTYCNHSLTKISKRFGRKAPMIKFRV